MALKFAPTHVSECQILVASIQFMPLHSLALICPQPACLKQKVLKMELDRSSNHLQDDQLEIFEVLGRGGSGVVYRGE